MIDAISAEEKMRLVYEFADRYHWKVKDLIDYRSQGYSIKQIAAITKTPVKVVGYTFHNFILNFRKHMKRTNIY
jgi:hypothetical protein